MQTLLEGQNEKGELPNYIGGHKYAYGDNTFNVKSQFYDYCIKIPNSTEISLGQALSKANKARHIAAKLSFEERAGILRKAADGFSMNSEEEEHLVKMTGMPIKYVRERLGFTKDILETIPSVAVARHNTDLKHIVREIAFKGYEARLAPEGIISAFIPPNDPAEAAFVFAHTVMSGGSIIIKPSQHEPYMALKLANLITEQGYPKGSLNVINWNTADKSRKLFANKLIDRSVRRIIMGDIETANGLLAEKDEEGRIIREAYSKGKNCLLCAGKSKTIINSPKNLEEAIKQTVDCSLNWTNDCVTTKVAIVVGEKEVAYEMFKKYFDAKSERVGDPLNENTEIGYIPENIANELQQKINTASEFQRIKLINGPFQRLGNNQIKPVLVEAYTPDIDFVTSEIPYLLTLVNVNTLEDAIEFVKKASDNETGGKSMAVSVYTDCAEKDMSSMMEINTHMLYINQPTIDLNPYLRHQDIDMTEFLTRPLSINLRK